MSLRKFLFAAVSITLIACAPFFAPGVHAGSIWVKCHITCRCLTDNSVGNFQFMIPIDRSTDMGHEADLACKVYGHRTCSDGCNTNTKFTYTYQVTAP